jgi:DNA polymerase V
MVIDCFAARVPVSDKQEVSALSQYPARTTEVCSNVLTIYQASSLISLTRPLYQTRVSASFPSPADDYLEGALDLNKHLIKHPVATYYGPVIGDSMTGEQIYDGDLLVVDRMEEIKDGDIVVARVNDEFRVKLLRISGDQVRLCSANPKYADIEITPDLDWEIWERSGISRSL